MGEWQNRPLDAVYPVIFVDALRIKVGDGRVTDRPFYRGHRRDRRRPSRHPRHLGEGEGAMFWLRVFTEIKDRGVDDVCMAVCDGLEGLPEAITTTWAQTVVETCAAHLIRKSFRYASGVAGRGWPRTSGPSTPLRPSRGRGPVRRVRRHLGRPLPGDHRALAVGVVGVRAVPGLRRRDPQGDLRDQRHRKPQRPLPASDQGSRALPDRAGRAELPLPGHPIPRPGREGRARWAMRWKPALNAFAITFAGRVVPGNGS